MKLIDLQEAFDTAIDDIDYDDEFIPAYVSPETGEDELGRGEFSRVSSDKNDPHLVDKEQLNKLSRNRIVYDMFDLYAEKIAEERLWELIHFPRVYAIKKYTDRYGEARSKWKMEKLIPLASISQEEMKRLTHRYFIPSIAERIAEEDYHHSEFADFLSEAIKHGEWDWFKDKTLEKASEKLEDMYTDLRQDYGYDAVSLDLHDENIMVRRTQNGLQVVYSDPFAGRHR